MQWPHFQIYEAFYSTVFSITVYLTFYLHVLYLSTFKLFHLVLSELLLPQTDKKTNKYFFGLRVYHPFHSLIQRELLFLQIITTTTKKLGNEQCTPLFQLSMRIKLIEYVNCVILQMYNEANGPTYANKNLVLE